MRPINEDYVMYGALDEIVGDERQLATASPGISKQKLASAIHTFDVWLGDYMGLGLGGFRWPSRLNQFEKNMLKIYSTHK